MIGRRRVPGVRGVRDVHLGAFRDASFLLGLVRLRIAGGSCLERDLAGPQRDCAIRRMCGCARRKGCRRRRDRRAGRSRRAGLSLIEIGRSKRGKNGRRRNHGELFVPDRRAGLPLV